MRRLDPCVEVEALKKCTWLWREAHLEVKSVKIPHGEHTFGSCEVEKAHAAVARSKFGSQNRKKLTCSEHFWKFRRPKIARGCGAKHIWKSKSKKLTSSGCFWTFKLRFAWQAQGILRLVKSELNAKREGFIAFPKTLAGVRDLLSRVRKVAFCVAGAVTSHLGG